MSGLHVIPPARIAHVTGTVIASLITLEGAGALAFSAVAGAVGVPASCMLAGGMLAAAGLAGAYYGQTRRRVLDLRRPEAQPARDDAV